MRKSSGAQARTTRTRKRVRTGARIVLPPAAPGSTAPYQHPKFGVIVAAGQGVRFGAYKQLVPLGDTPVFMYSVRAFEQCPRVLGYVLVAPARRLSLVRRIVRSYNVHKLLDIVPGGETRALSVRAGLACLPEDGCVAIHDAARPIITAQMLDRGFAACRKYGAAAFGHPVTDTLKSVRGQSITSTVSRESLIAVQTPQFFKLPLLRQAYGLLSGGKTRSPETNIRSATDDCALVERLGVEPRWLAGPRTNLKITLREDLTLCQALL